MIAIYVMIFLILGVILALVCTMLYDQVRDVWPKTQQVVPVQTYQLRVTWKLKNDSTGVERVIDIPYNKTSTAGFIRDRWEGERVEYVKLDDQGYTIFCTDTIIGYKCVGG